MGWDVDSTDYRKAAEQCHTLSTAAITRVSALYDTYESCVGMAGDYSLSLEWIGDYDSAATDWISSGTLFARALRHYGDVLAAMAYNWDVSNQTIPHPDPPFPSEPILDSYSGLHSARGANGAGIEIDGVGLSSVEPIPNGDTGKLLTAKDLGWRKHALHPDLADAGDRIKEIGYKFDYSTAEVVDDIRRRLETLRAAALGIADAAEIIEKAVGEYRDALEELRSSIARALEAAIPSVTVTVEPVQVLVECAAPIFSKDLEEPVYSTITTSGFTGIVGRRPFTRVSDLDFHVGELRTIIALPITLLDDDPGGGENPGNQNSVPAPILTTASEKYVRDKHYPGGPLNSEWKSTFYATEDPYALVDAAKNSPAIDQGDGTYRREVTVTDRYIGNESEKRGGAATQRYIVVQDRFGAVITMHPAGEG